MTKVPRGLRALALIPGALALAAFAGAEARSLRPVPSRSLIHIAPDDVVPDRIELPGDEGFRFVNDAPRTARVVFDRGVAGSVDCQGAGGATGRRSNYLVETGESLRCRAAAGKVKYTVYRENGEGRLVETRGEVRLR
jgi:hypothetical protein